MHRFILDDDSINKFDDICDKNLENFWECKSEKIDLPKDFEEHEISLFDICQLQKDENKFSNALSYFIQKYPKLWIKFLEEYFEKKYSFGEIISVSREENAKVDGKDNTGGRIDLLIRTENSYIIIENKIDRIEGLKAFNVDGYYFDADSSLKKELVFKRDEQLSA